MLMFDSLQELVEAAQHAGKTVSEIVLADQAISINVPDQELVEKMAYDLQIMRESVNTGLHQVLRSNSGLSGGNALRYRQAVEQGTAIAGTVLPQMLMKALAASEMNACMGRIVAAPTAGSCGIIPAAVLTIAEERNIPDHKVIMSLFTAAGVGLVIAKGASISGAEGGCQAECGSASAMAAAALVELAGGSPHMIAHACAIALKNIMGLVCDPVAGLVEVPCIKRNAMGVANALVAADLALSGIESVIPADEVVAAMRSVGEIMAPVLKETAEGGLAATPTGIRLAKGILGDA